MKLRRLVTVFILVLLLISTIGIMNIEAVNASSSLDSNSIVYVNAIDSPGYEYPVENNASSGEITDTAFQGTYPSDEYVENHLSLSAYAKYVDSNNERTLVEIVISGVGYGEKHSYTDSAEDTHFWSPYAVELWAQQGDISHSTNLHVNSEFHQGENTGGEVEEGDSFYPEQAQLAMGAASFAPVIGNAIGATDFMLTAYDAAYDNNNKIIESPYSGSGPDAKAGCAWYIEEENETLYNDDGVAFVFSTQISWRIDADDREETHELEIGAKIDNKMYTIHNWGDSTSYDYGAEATVEITIKNARPELSLDTDKDTYYTSDYTTSDDGPYIVSPKFDISLDNPAGDNTTKYDITMDIKFDGSSYETLTYFFYRDIDDDISQYITIEVPDGYDGSVSIKFTVETRYERHGGWIETFEISESFDVVEDGRDDSDDGGSGGGTPPPGGVVPTGNETSLEGG